MANLVNTQAVVGEVNIEDETVVAVVEVEQPVSADLTIPTVVTEESNWRNVEAEAETLAAGSDASAVFTMLEDGVKFTFGIPQGIKGDTGNVGPMGTITSVVRTSGTGAAGTVDTYTATCSDGSTFTFNVYNGKDGLGSGDMSKVTYDTHNKNRDIFDYADLKYTKPSGGIPKTDLASAVQTSLGKADTALQTHQDISGKANKPTTLTFTLLASGWTGNTYALGYADSDLEIELDASATDEMVEAWSNAKMVGSASSNTLTAKGDVPTIDITCILKRTVK